TSSYSSSMLRRFAPVTHSSLSYSLTSPPFLLNDPPPPEIYTLSLHDALPISTPLIHLVSHAGVGPCVLQRDRRLRGEGQRRAGRSEEHTSELQSRENLVCRLLLEKKKKRRKIAKRSDRRRKTCQR